MNLCNKLESNVCVRSLPECCTFQVFHSRLLTLLTNIRLGWKGFIKDKHYSLLRTFRQYGHKKFITLGPNLIKSRGLYYKTFYGQNLRVFIII